MGVDLTEGDILKTVYRTSLPMVITLAMGSMLNLVDAFFVGKINSQALAAVGLGFQVVFFVMMLGSGVSAGVTSVVSRLIGAKEYGKAKIASEHGILSAVVVSIILSVILLLTAPAILDFMGAKASLMDDSLAYLNVLLFFSAFQFMGLVLTGIVSAEGEMKVVMKAGVYSNILNVILDPLFIFTFGLGIRGAAIATVISQLYSLLYLASYLFSGNSWVRPDFNCFTYDFRHIRDIYSLALPMSLSNLSMSIAYVIQTSIVGLFGTGALAASTIGMRMYSLGSLPGAAISTAVVSIAGQCIGAGKYDRAKETVVRGGFLAATIMGGIGLIFYVFAADIVQFFTSSAPVIEYSISFLRITAPGQVALGFALCFGSVLVAAGKGKQLLMLKVLRTFLPLPICYWLSTIYGVPGIWAGITFNLVLYLIISMALFRYGGWDRGE
ncbi:MAG: MATE family efflux transporter [Candidatus Altiarchaeota archaeon]